MQADMLERYVASHFSSIGFTVTVNEDIDKLVQQTAAAGDDIPTARGRYLRWSPGAGRNCGPASISNGT